MKRSSKLSEFTWWKVSYTTSEILIFWYHIYIYTWMIFDMYDVYTYLTTPKISRWSNLPLSLLHSDLPFCSAVQQEEAAKLLTVDGVVEVWWFWELGAALGAGGHPLKKHRHLGLWDFPSLKELLWWTLPWISVTTLIQLEFLQTLLEGIYCLYRAYVIALLV